MMPAGTSGSYPKPVFEGDQQVYDMVLLEKKLKQTLL